MDIKSGRSKIQLSPLQKYSCIEEWLIDLGLSKSWIKKKLAKKELQKKLPRIAEFSCDLLNKNMINPVYSGSPINIISQDDQYLVLEKPSGVHGHALEYSDKNNILSFIRSVGWGKLLSINIEKAERGLLFRLDLETSGLLIYIKNQALFDELFENRKILITQKFYLAVVKGKTESQDKLTDYLLGSESKGAKMKIDPNGQQANLSYKTLNYNKQKNYSLIEVCLETGLRHQIRIQLSHAGHPLLGDVKYGGEKADRLYLHAHKYCINLDHELVFESEIPISFF
jgi:23S rRNA pseudouridine1911/1915/1917 synthase